MKKFLGLFLALVGAVAVGQIPITQLPQANLPLTGSEQVPMVQSGNTKQATVAAIQATAAPINGPFVLATSTPSLTQSRVLVGTANQIILTDGGALGNLTLSAPQDIAPASSPTFTGLTLSGLNGLLVANSGSPLTVAAGVTCTNQFVRAFASTGTGTCASVNLASDVTGNLPVTNLNSGTGATAGTYWRGDGTWGTPSGAASAANPTGTVGLTTVNGSLGTFMRSDGAPPLDQGIAPTWTGKHTFTPGSTHAINITTGDLQLNGSAGTSGNVLTSAGANTLPTWTAPAVSGVANPSASVGLTPVNGSATTAIRSDGAPALSQAIVPNWTGKHTFTQTGAANAPISINYTSAGNATFISMSDSTAADNFHIDMNGDSGFLILGGANSTNGGNCVTNGALAPYWCLNGSGVVPFSFGTNGIERLRIDGNGRFIFNAPSVTGSSSFTFNGINGNNVMAINSAAGSGTAFGVDLRAGTTSADYSLVVRVQGGATDYFKVRGDGDPGGGIGSGIAIEYVSGYSESYSYPDRLYWHRNRDRSSLEDGSVVTVQVPAITCTSNTTAMTMTGMNSAFQPTHAQAMPIGYGCITNNTASTTNTGGVNMTAGSPTIVFTVAGSTTGFTGSGTKGFSGVCSFTYSTD